MYIRKKVVLACVIVFLLIMFAFLSRSDLNNYSDNSIISYNNDNLLTVSQNIEGVLSFIKNGKSFLLAYFSISERYKVFLIAPEDEVFKAIAGIDKEILDSQAHVQSSTIIIRIITFVIVILIGVYLSNQITNPIVKLNELAMHIAKNVTSDDLFDNIQIEDSINQDDEIGDLT